MIREDVGLHRISDHHLGELAVRRRDHQVTDRHDAHQFARLIDDVEIEECFELAAFTDFIDGTLSGGIGGERHEFGGHDSAHRAFGIIDNLPHGGLTLRVQQRQDSFAALFGQAVDERDGIVRIGADD